MKVVLLLAFLACALAWAPFHVNKDAVADSYLVKISQQSVFEKRSEVVAWLKDHDIAVKALTFFQNFNMISVTCDMDTVHLIRQLYEVEYVETDSIITLPTFSSENVLDGGDNVQAQGPNASGNAAGDWGQSRIDSRLATNPQTFSPCVAGEDVDCGGSNAYIYIVDTGVRRDHVAFGGRAIFGADFAGGMQDPEQYNGDCNGHGTHCAGSAAGGVASSGVFADGTTAQFGMAHLATIVSVRVLNCAGSGSITNVISGYNWVVSEAKKRPTYKNILSASLGGGFSASVNDAVESAIAAGVQVVVAAGNDGANACDYSPASAPSAITVGAIDNSTKKTSWSNWGKCVTVFAPGNQIKSAWYTSANALNTISGTSMATPLTAGAIAYLPKIYTNAQIVQLIADDATPNLVINPGVGSPNLIVFDRWSKYTN